MMAFYTYLWLREDGTPYYAGAGSGNRAYERHELHGNPPPRDRIILQEFPDWPTVLEGEKFLIAMYGRVDRGNGCLRNLTDGGEGQRNPSLETRIKIGTAMRGRKHTSATRAKLSAAKKGRKFSPAHYANLSISMLDNKRGAGNKNTRGKHPSQETRAKLSVAKMGNTNSRGHICSLETRAKLRAARTGRKPMLGHRHSVETRAKMSESHRHRYPEQGA
jgi:hypothetical protein